MSIANPIRSQLVPIHPEGYPFIGGFALLLRPRRFLDLALPSAASGALLVWYDLLLPSDPPRVTAVRDGLIIAPADGRISQIALAAPPAEMGLGTQPLPRISIFMSVFDCRINRSPVSGQVERMVYHAGNSSAPTSTRRVRTTSAIVLSSLRPARASALCKSQDWSHAVSCRSCARSRM
jgi:phosphatidylserine decarboxylase